MIYTKNNNNSGTDMNEEKSSFTFEESKSIYEDSIGKTFDSIKEKSKKDGFFPMVIFGMKETSREKEGENLVAKGEYSFMFLGDMKEDLLITAMVDFFKEKGWI